MCVPLSSALVCAKGGLLEASMGAFSKNVHYLRLFAMTESKASQCLVLPSEIHRPSSRQPKTATSPPFRCASQRYCCLWLRRGSTIVADAFALPRGFKLAPVVPETPGESRRRQRERPVRSREPSVRAFSETFRLGKRTLIYFHVSCCCLRTAAGATLRMPSRYPSCLSAAPAVHPLGGCGMRVEPLHILFPSPLG